MKNNFHSINSHLLVLPLNVLKVVGWFLSVRAGFEIGKREEEEEEEEEKGKEEKEEEEEEEEEEEKGFDKF